MAGLLQGMDEVETHGGHGCFQANRVPLDLAFPRPNPSPIAQPGLT